MAYFTVDELRERFTEIDAGQYPDSLVESVRATAEESFEDACNVSFVPRNETDVLSGSGTPWLDVLRPRVRSLASLTVDGATVDPTTVRTFGSSLLYREVKWDAGVQNVEVTYSHGYEAPPLRVKQAVMLLTRVWLVEGPVSDRATQLPTESGGSINQATPGMLGATFGIPEVDVTVKRYRRRTYVF